MVRLSYVQKTSTLKYLYTRIDIVMKQLLFGIHIPIMGFSIDRCNISNSSDDDIKNEGNEKQQAFITEKID
jgi:hypothetical protein